VPDLTDEVEPATVRQHQVEDDEVGTRQALASLTERGREHRFEAIALERVRHRFGDGRFVFHDQDPVAHSPRKVARSARAHRFLWRRPGAGARSGPWRPPPCRQKKT
jgi:hypothetical protein